MKDYFPGVLNEFRRYGILLSDAKTVAFNPLQTKPSKSGHPTELCSCPLSHPDPYGDLEMQIRLKPSFIEDYELKLFWKEVDSRPVFRFESWGEPHINPFDGRTLPERKIHTPHFHKIESDGRMRAYRTDFLNQSDQEENVRKDYSVGVQHFCQEANIQDSNGGKIVVTMLNSPLGLSITNDPLEGVTF